MEKEKRKWSLVEIVERAAKVIEKWPKEMQLERNRYPKSRHSIKED